MKKIIGFILNNWAKLWALILLTILVFYVSQACNTICNGYIGTKSSVYVPMRR